MSETAFCYHCAAHHPLAAMRQIETKGGGKRWRCLKSIEAAKKGREEREAFGRRMTEANKAEAQAIRNRMVNPERSPEK